ncbi:MAG: nicotinamide mononucleotide transporter, partial [Monoglobaceae bacterium]
MTIKFDLWGLNKKDIVLWLVSVIIVGGANILGGTEPVKLLATLIGVTALIFLAKGDVRGQILIVIFSFLYAATSFKFRYYGEMITYLCMTMPIAVLSAYSWIKNPYKKNEVKIHRLTFKQKNAMVCLTIVV